MTPIFTSRDDDTLGTKLLRLHWPVLLITSLLCVVGAVTLYSVAGGSLEPWAERHVFRFLIGLGLVVLIALTPIRVWLTLAFPAYALALAALLLVPLIGTEALGARRWLSFGGVSFQPAEIMKVALIAALARYYQWLPSRLVSRPVWVLLPLLMIAVPSLLTMRQPDLGSSALFGVTGLVLMFLAGVSLFYFFVAAIGAGAAAPIIWSTLHDYQKRRIEIFLQPDADPLGAGYHIAQSKIALGAGGVSGKGFMQGTQSQLDFLPEKHTDFIFTMLSEEWGFVGAVAVLALFALLLACLMTMSWRVKSEFGRLMIAGCALTIFIYVFINVAMVTGIVPVVGVPLPFVSYGGTSLVTLMIGLGLAMSAHVHGREAIDRRDLRVLV